MIEATKTVFANIFKLFVPSTVSGFLEVGVDVMNAIFVGQLNDQQLLATFGIGDLITKLLAQTPLWGFNSALETFVSQGFGK